MIRFIGKIRSGKGKHSELIIPGVAELNGAPPNWPTKFHPGSLNIGIAKDGYPEGFADPDAGGRGITPLDDGVIKPTVVLPWDKIGNNGLKPKKGSPDRGTGQFWPAIITVISTGDAAHCWAFRRINSSIRRQLEIVAATSLRNLLHLNDGVDVFVDIAGEDEYHLGKLEPKMRND